MGAHRPLALQCSFMCHREVVFEQAVHLELSAMQLMTLNALSAGLLVALTSASSGLKACYLGAFAKTGFSPEYQHRSPLGP
jgi:hypothetical protein